ncbi:MAG: cache domain-containing protein [Desulfobacterium sp.]|nr:cache domain-containing protein [Desulfobacterium sp.]
MKAFIQNLPVRHKLFFLLSMIITVAILTEGLYVSLTVKKALEKNIESELTNTTRAILDTVKTGATISIKNRLRGVAEKNHEMVSFFHARFLNGKMSEQEAKQLASEVLLSQTVGRTGYIFCLDSSGNLKVHPEATLRDMDISNHDFVKKQIRLKQGYIEYEWPFPEDQNHPKVLYMVYFKPWDWIISVSAYRSEFKELVNIDDFREAVLSRKFGKSGYSHILDTQGNLILHPKLEGTNIYDAVDAEGRRFIQEVCTTKNGKIIYPWKNPGEKSSRQKLVIFNHLPEYDWIVASSSYLEEFYSPLKIIRTAIASTAILTLTAALIATLWISSLVTTRLETLIKNFEQGARGDFTARIPVTAGDEIGRLQHCFNLFMAELDAHHRKLEELVRSRTAELEQEVGERARAEKALERQMKLLDTFINTIPCPVFLKDRNGIYMGCNNAFADQILGLAANGVLGKSLFEFNEKIPLERAILYKKMDDALIKQGGDQQYEGQVRCADDTDRDFQFYKACFYAPNGKVAGIAGVMMDLTEINRAKVKIQEQSEKLHQANLKLSQLASLDSLTQIANRRTFQKELEHQIRLAARNKSSLTLVMADIDHFKKYNDSFGHTAGDQVLETIARLLTNGSRGTDTVARYGGEEFAVILPATDRKGALTMGERFCHNVAGHPWKQRRVTLSIGLATATFATVDDTTVEQTCIAFVDRADRALYASKEGGRNRVTHEDELG